MSFTPRNTSAAFAGTIRDSPSDWPAQPVVISDKDRNYRDFDPAWHLTA